MVRTQIQLPEEQVTLLKSLAARRHVSMAEVIRQAIDLLARSEEQDRLRERAAGVAGRFHSRTPDLAAEHDAHLSGAFSG